MMLFLEIISCITIGIGLFIGAIIGLTDNPISRKLMEDKHRELS